MIQAPITIDGATSATLLAHLDKLIEAVTYDDSGNMGRGGNGGLISRDTTKLTDQLRLMLSDIRRGRK